MNFLGHASDSGRPDRDVALALGAFQNFAFPVENHCTATIHELHRGNRGNRFSSVMKVRREGGPSVSVVETKGNWRASSFPTDKPGSIWTL